MSKLVTLLDPQGQAVDVPQERVVPLMRSGFSAKGGQTVTLGDEKHTEIPIERLATGLSQGMNPIIESSEGRFKREAEQQYGGLGGAAKGLAYGGLQAATLGLGGKGLMAAGLASPEDLAKLQEAQGGAIFGGELAGGLALAPFTGGASAGEAAGVAAAKTLGRKVAESAGREALIGAGYGAGSEATQAGIEGREANLGQAATGGATVGGLFGAAIPVVGAAAGRAAERKAAAQAAKDAEVAAGVAPVSGAPATASPAMAAKAEEIRAAAANKSAMAQSLADEYQAIHEAAHTLAPGATAKAGGNLGGALETAIGKTKAAMDRTASAITKTRDAFSMIDNVEDMTKAIADANVDALAARSALATDRIAMTRLYNSHLEDLTLAREAGKNESVRQGIQARADAVSAKLDQMNRMDALLSKVGVLQHEGANLGREAATNVGAQNLAKRDIARTMRKLESLGERSLEVAGTEAPAARQAAEELTARVEQAGLQSEASQAEMATNIVGGDKKSLPFSQRLAAVAHDPAQVRQVVQDLAAADVAHGKTSSLFFNALGRDGVREAVTALPEAAAYVHAFADAAASNDGLKRATGRRFAKLIEGLRGAGESLEPTALAAIREEAVADASRVIGAVEADNRIGFAAQKTYDAMLRPVERVAEAVAPKAEVAAKNIVAASPEQTAALRATLETHEGTLAQLETAGSDIAKRRMANKAEIEILDKQIAAEKSNNVRDALKAKRSVLDGQSMRLETLADEVGSARQSLAQDAANIRQSRALTAKAAAQGAENVARAKAARDAATRELKGSNLEREALRGTQKLSAQRELVADLQALRDRAKQADEVLEAFESAGGGSAFTKSKFKSGAYALDAEGTFQRDWSAFLNTAEGRAMRKAMEAESKAAAKIFGDPNKVMGALGAVEIMHGVFGGGWLPTLIGGVMAAKSGKAGLAKAASTVLNPVAFCGGVSRAVNMMERGSIPTGRTMAVNKGYTFSVPAANAYVDAILKDRQAANDAFDSLVKSGGINPAEIQNARQRFDAAVDYLERKRPAASNGADAQAFARSVALLRNPDLLAKFVHDGSLRQQDVDVLQLVSPEAYEQLKSAVQLLQEKKPDMAMNLAPLFKLMSKMKVSARGGGGLSLAMAQSLIGAAPSSQGPMVPGAEAAAARARPGKESSLVESTKL